jgi:hypothetical protein
MTITITPGIGIFCIVCACPPTLGNDDTLCDVRPHGTKTHLVQPFVVGSRKAGGPHGRKAHSCGPDIAPVVQMSQELGPHDCHVCHLAGQQID